MDPWLIGLIMICVIGVAVIGYGALNDRAKNKRRAAEMMAPPNRSIPQFKPDAAAPHYLSDLQARRPPEEAEPTDLSQSEREAISQQIKEESTVKIDVGYANRTFVTDPTSSWAVLDQPMILVCAEPVDTIRELISVLEKLILSKTGLIVVAPALGGEVLGTLEVNKIRQTMPLLAVISPDLAQLDKIATSTGASILERTDLQASYVTPEQLGRCERWVSDNKRSFVIAGAGQEAVRDSSRMSPSD